VQQGIGAVGLNLARVNSGLQCKNSNYLHGGCHEDLPYTTAPEELTGDGLALAYRGAQSLSTWNFPVLTLLFIHPLALKGNNFPYILTINLETHALNRKGERYMRKWDPERFEFTTRDLNSIAAMIEILEGRGSELGAPIFL